MKFSLIIPIFNCEKYLNRCIDSVLEQNYTDFEMILVNDGSTDKSLEICKNYAENNDNITVIDKINGGASSARNAGLDSAKGEYVIFVDSDDRVADNFFDLICNKELKGGLSVFNYFFVSNEGEKARKMPSELIKPQLDYFNKVKLLILSRTINSPVAKVYDRELIEKYHIRFDERMPVAEDFNFNLSYLAKCRDVKIFDDLVYFYRVGVDGSLITRKKDGLIDIYPIVFNEAYKTIDSFKFNAGQKNELFMVWDKLHTDSFATCIMEEFKSNANAKQIKKEIFAMCEKFQSEYYITYGYCSLVHFVLRKCIKHKFVNTLYVCGKIYVKFKR